MKGLMLKDIALLRGQKKLLLVVILVCIMTFFSGIDGSFIIGYICFMAVMISLTTLTYDEYENGMSFLMTLPVTRKEYVMEKYLFSFLASFLGGLFGLVICFIYFAVTKSFSMEGATSLLVVCFTELVMIGIVIMLSIPLIIKFGAEKGRIVLVSITCMLTLLIYGSYKATSFAKATQKIEFFVRQNSIFLLIFTVTFYGLFLLFSMKTAISFLEKKEI